MLLTRLIRNFAHGALGLVLNFNVEQVVYQHHQSIIQSLTVLLRDKNTKVWKKEELQWFQQKHRDEILKLYK
jgi:hypothetical protein